MGRPQRPIPDDDRSPEAEFARALRRLRAEAANPTYAQLQRRTGYSDTTLSAAASGRGRPSRDVVQALVVALGGDPAEWDDRWRALPAPEPAPVPAPPEPAPAVPSAGAPPPSGRRRTAVLAGAVALLVAIAVTGSRLADDEGSAAESSPETPAVPVTVQNQVTAGPAAMREDSPAYLSARPENSCRARGCLAPGDATFDTGDTLEVVCQVTGERTTNGNDGDPADDSNPELFTSTRWYGSRLPDGSLGYLAETWLSPADRGGLGLPRCG